MNETKSGRKAKYSYEDLEKIVEQFALTNVGEEITIPKLVKISGIPRHIWRYNKQIKRIIESLNHKTINIDSNNSELETLPNVEELVNTNYANKKKLIKALSSYSSYINKLYETSLLYQKQQEEFEKLEQEVNDLQKQLEKAKSDIEFYKNEMKKMTIDSTSLKLRKEKGIKNNVLSINDKNKKMAGAILTEMDDLTSDIFDTDL